MVPGPAQGYAVVAGENQHFNNMALPLHIVGYPVCKHPLRIYMAGTWES